MAGVPLKKNPGIDHLPDTFSPGGINARGPVIIFSDPLEKGWRGCWRRVHSSFVAAAALDHLHGLVVTVLADQVDVAEDVLLGVLGEALRAVFCEVGLALRHLLDPLHFLSFHGLAS